MAVRWKFNMDGFTALRNHPALVAAMEAAAHQATTNTPFEVRVEVWPHRGIKTGPRTSVQVWADSPEARRRINENPGELVGLLDRMQL